MVRIVFTLVHMLLYDILCLVDQSFILKWFECILKGSELSLKVVEVVFKLVKVVIVMLVSGPSSHVLIYSIQSNCAKLICKEFVWENTAFIVSLNI